MGGIFSPFTKLYDKQDRKRVFRKTMKFFGEDPLGSIGNPAIMQGLIYGWGNEMWSALDEYLVVIIKKIQETEGPILECGSGLSTFIMGAIAQKLGREIWALENSPEWAERLSTQLEKYNINSVHLCLDPLKNYGEYDWYQPPLEKMPGEFPLIICDGPPGSTHGGRYGLLPVMREKIKPGAIILLDDGEREEEKNIAQRWAEDLNTEWSLHGEKKPYIFLQVP